MTQFTQHALFWNGFSAFSTTGTKTGNSKQPALQKRFLTCCHLKMEYKVDPEMTWFSLNLSLCFFTSGHLRQDGQTKGSPQRQRDRQVTERQVWKMKMRCLSDQWQSVAYRRVGDGYRSALIFVKAWLWTDVVRSSINHNQHGFGWKIWPWTF